MSKEDRRVDCGGFMHAEWCTCVTTGDIDNCDICDCNPCNVCEGHAQYTDEHGEMINCVGCDAFPFKKQGERHRRER